MVQPWWPHLAPLKTLDISLLRVSDSSSGTTNLAPGWWELFWREVRSPAKSEVHVELGIIVRSAFHPCLESSETRHVGKRVWCSIRVLQRNRPNRVYLEQWKGRLKKRGRRAREAGKSHQRLSASWRPRKAGGASPKFKGLRTSERLSVSPDRSPEAWQSRAPCVRPGRSVKAEEGRAPMTEGRRRWMSSWTGRVNHPPFCSSRGLSTLDGAHPHWWGPSLHPIYWANH